MNRVIELNAKPLHEQLEVVAVEPDVKPGELAPEVACAEYEIHTSNPAVAPVKIKFHHGDLSEGPKGISDEALLAVLIDRLRAHARGPLGSHETSLALNHLEKAQGCLVRRTAGRIERGVEGTQQA